MNDTSKTKYKRYDEAFKRQAVELDVVRGLKGMIFSYPLKIELAGSLNSRRTAALAGLVWGHSASAAS